MKKEPKKLKLTKLTVSDLNRVKGGKPQCACDYLLTNGAFIRDYTSPTSYVPTKCA